MTSIVAKRRVIWNVDELKRDSIEKIRDERVWRTDRYPGVQSESFECRVNSKHTEWAFVLGAGDNDYCQFRLFSYDGEYFLEDPHLQVKMRVGIKRQNDGIVKEIKHCCCALSEYGGVAGRGWGWYEFMTPKEIFDEENDYVDLEGTLTFIIDVVIAYVDCKLHKDSLKSLCGLQLIRQISTKNVLELLFYAYRTNSKLLEDECLDSIVMNFDELKKQDHQKWKTIDTKLTLKIIDAFRCFMDSTLTVSNERTIFI